jgi:hypothetical protein
MRESLMRAVVKLNVLPVLCELNRDIDTDTDRGNVIHDILLVRRYI